MNVSPSLIPETILSKLRSGSPFWRSVGWRVGRMFRFVAAVPAVRPAVSESMRPPKNCLRRMTSKLMHSHASARPRAFALPASFGHRTISQFIRFFIPSSQFGRDRCAAKNSGKNVESPFCLSTCAALLAWPRPACHMTSFSCSTITLPRWPLPLRRPAATIRISPETV